MAINEFQVFNEFAIHIGEKKIDLELGTFKMGLITDVLSPTATSTAVWATFSGNEVSGTNYDANGKDLTAPELVLLGNVATFDATADLVWSQSGTGFDDARWGILYESTADSDEAVGFLDLGGDVGNVAGDLTIAFHANGILTITVADTIA